MDKLNAAATTLEAIGWKFDGKAWQPPTDRHGNTASAIVEDMGASLENYFDFMINMADRDVYAASVVDQLGPLLDAWRQIRPTPSAANDVA